MNVKELVFKHTKKVLLKVNGALMKFVPGQKVEVDDEIEAELLATKMFEIVKKGK